MNSRLEQYVNMIGHDARRIQVVFSARVVQNGLKRDVTLGGRKFPVLARRKRDRVFCPWALKMRKAPPVVRSPGSFRYRNGVPRGA